MTYEVLPLGFILTKETPKEEFVLDLDSDAPMDPICDLSEDGTCDSCQ